MIRRQYGIRDTRPQTGQAGGLYSMAMNTFKNLVYALTLLVLLAASSSVFAQTVNQCRGKWVLTTLQEMNFGEFAAEGGGATLTMSSTGGLSLVGPVTVSPATPSTAWTVNVDNSLGPVCATYGFTIELRREPRALRGPGGPSTELPLDNVRATIPTYGLTNVALHSGITILPQVIPANAGNTAPFTMTIYGEITVNGPQPAGDYSRNLVVQTVQNGRRRRVVGRPQATSIVPLSLVESTAMDFGTIAGGPTAGTIVLSTGSGRIASGDVQLLASGPGSAATFQLTGEPNYAYSISFGDGSLASGAGPSMSVTTFTHNSAGTVPGSGTESFQVGATLSVGSNQPAGTYSTLTGGSAYTVTINYN